MKRIVPFVVCGLSMICLSGLAHAQGLFAPYRVTAHAEDIRTEGQLEQEIKVTFESYSNMSRVDVSTLGDGDILVTGPNGYEQRGTFISAQDISPQNDGILLPDGEFPNGGFPPTVIVASYQVLPSLVHDGPWSPDQNGVYSIQLRQGEVRDSSGFSFPPSLIGSFRVALGNNSGGVPVLPGETRIRIIDDHAMIDPIEPILPHGYSAHVELLFSQPNVEVSLTSFRQENNTFIANFEAISYPGDGAFFPTVMHVHSELIHLGPLVDGNYRFVVRSQNQQLAVKEFVVGGNPSDTRPPEASASSEPISSPKTDPHRIRVIYEDASGVDLSTLDDNDLFVQDVSRCILQNEPNAAGDIICFDHARLAVEFVEATPSNTTGTRVEAIYLVLPPANGWSAAANGNYQIINASQEICDTVGNCNPQRAIGALNVAMQPNPNAMLTVDASDPQNVSAEVILTLPPQHVVTETSITRENGTIFLDASAFATPGVPGENTSPRVEMLSYTIGELPAGQYLAVFRLNGERLDAEGFVIKGDPGPIRPNIAFINIEEGNASHFAEVGVVLDRPGIDVLSWGEVSREENRFIVEIIVGPSDATIDPNEPPVALPNGWDAAIGGFPFRLVTNQYPLGVLQAGNFVFVITFGNVPVARKAFVVGGTGPKATLSAENIEEPKTTPHRFMIGFQDSDGLDHESIQSAAVSVHGPDGFEAEATLETYISTLDPLGAGASATYSLAAPGDTWDAEDSGGYRVSIDASAVLDLAGNPLARGELGGFTVRILPEPPVLPGNVEITTRLDDGVWIADVKIEDEGIRVTNWGEELIRHGRSILALAEAVEIDPNENTPGVPPNNEHRYTIGALSPGYYVFVFKSDLGHCGIARIRVPGMGDGGFNAWKEWMRDGIAAGEDARFNFLAYAFAMRQDRHPAPEVEPAIFEGEDGRRHGGLRFRRLHGADDVEFIIQCSRDMIEWQDAGGLAEIIDREIDIDGTEIVHVCLVDSLSDCEFPFLRVVAKQVNP